MEIIEPFVGEDQFVGQNRWEREAFRLGRQIQHQQDVEWWRRTLDIPNDKEETGFTVYGVFVDWQDFKEMKIE